MSKLAKALTAAAGNAGGQPDPDFNQVSLLLNGDGTDGGQNNTYTDSSSNGHTITPAGTIEQGSVSPFGDNWANYFDGVDDRLTSSTNFTAIGTDDFTIEFWYNGGSQADRYPCIIGTLDAFDATGAWRVTTYNNNANVFQFAFETTPYIFTTNNYNDGVWRHFAVTRQGTNLKGFVNGVQQGSTLTMSSNLTSRKVLLMSQLRDTDYHSGYISNVRVIKGTALYTSDFTPPTEPLTAITGTELLTCQSNNFVDNSTNDFTFTVSGTPKVTSFNPFANSEAITLAANGGSVYVSGVDTQGFTTSTSSWGDFGTGDFSIEAWVYPESYDSVGGFRVFDTRAAAAVAPWMFGVRNSSNPFIDFMYGSNARITGSIAISLSTWTHIAVTRESGTVRLFVNGVLDTSATITSSINCGTSTPKILKLIDPGTNPEGYASNIRVVKGTAVYTSAFTPPTAPLTAVTNTSLLLNFADAAIFDYAALNNLNTIGNADISTSVVKYGTGSLAFDGTGDYLNLPVNPTLSFGVADFTIEGWMNVASIDATYRCIFSIGAPVQIYARSGTIECYFDSDDSGSPYMVNSLQGPASSITANTWHYFTVVRNGTTFTAYIDGVAGTPDTGVTGAVATSANAAAIGIYSASNTLPFTGYLDDLRITKGLARYTSAFTPPTAALPTF